MASETQTNGSSGNANGEGNNKADHPLLHDRPIVCILEDTNASEQTRRQQQQQRCRMFRVIRSKGKALASGGFGVTIATIGSSGREHNNNNNNNSSNAVVAKQENNDDNDDSKHEDTLLQSDEVPKDANKNTGSNQTETKDSQTKAARRSSEYLFIEEVLFLHEKGLLRAMLPSKATTNNNNIDIETNNTADATKVSDSNANENSDANKNTNENTNGTTPLDTSQLYQLLPSLGISLAMYRVYSHLRSQDFRVLRHDPDRYDILCLQNDDAEHRRQRTIIARQKQKQKQQQQKQQETEQTTASLLPREETTGESEGDAVPGDLLPPPRASSVGTNPRKQSLSLRHRVRESIQHAPPPSIPQSNRRNRDENASAIGICWDAYNPNSNFGKTHPGLPDFYVTATYYNVSMVVFSDLNALLKDKCRGIPLKVATVSDSGTVVMFGVTDYGIPSLVQNP